MSVEAPTLPEVSPSIETLTAMDRCDRCGAQAYVSALLESGDLLFCNHHWRDYQEKVEPIAIRIIDETWRLVN